MKATAIAPTNIAFIKYWGKKDELLRLPENGSISMNLTNLTTKTTVEYSSSYKTDSITINEIQKPTEGNRAIEHLDKIRKLAKLSQKAKVITINNFPIGTGLSSSASGFAALTVAGAKAAGLSLSEKELSILARQGSGSACRSIPDGFVEWLDGNSIDASYAHSLYPPSYWDIADVVAIVSQGKKEVSSSKGQELVNSSIFFPLRRSHMASKIILMKKLLKERNFSEFGELLEAEALELHAIMLTSIPSLIYWTSGTLKIMHLIKKWRSEGLEVYFTINTGQDIHLICERPNVNKLTSKLKELEDVKNIIVNYPSLGTRLTNNHLF